MSRIGLSVVLGGLLGFSLVATATSAEQGTAARPLPSPGQAKIIAALDQPTELDFRDQPLTDVIDFLQQKHEIEIQLDAKALTDAGVGTDTPITQRLTGIKLRSALRLLLNDLDLTYIVGHGYLMITSKTEAENHLILKVYPVRDLVTFDSAFRPPLAAASRSDGDYNALIDLITCTVAPTTWEGSGPPPVSVDRNSNSIAFSQTEEVHEEVAELLAALRRARDKQIAAAEPVAPAAERQPDPAKAPTQIRVYRLFRGQPLGGMDGGATPTMQDEEGRKQLEVIAAHACRQGSESSLDAWANALAKTIPCMIEPDTWQPVGVGQIRAVGDTVIVRQTDDVQLQVARLVNDVLPGSTAMLPKLCPEIRLRLPPNKTDWPQDAEPLPGNVESRIIEALDGPCELKFTERPLADVLSKLAEQSSVQIYLDQKALTDAGVGSDTPITRWIKGLSLREALKLLLDELELTYVIRNELLMVTSKTEAENMLTTRVYPVFDLLAPPRGAPTDRPPLNFQSLIDNITSNIQSNTWDDVGGPGSIQPFTSAGALVISQTNQAHEEITEFLKALRETRKVQE